MESFSGAILASMAFNARFDLFRIDEFHILFVCGIMCCRARFGRLFVCVCEFHSAFRHCLSSAAHSSARINELSVECNDSPTFTVGSAVSDMNCRVQSVNDESVLERMIEGDSVRWRRNTDQIEEAMDSRVGHCRNVAWLCSSRSSCC